MALFVVGFLWLKSHDARVKAEALAEARRDSVIYALAQRDSLTAALADTIRVHKRQQAAAESSMVRYRRNVTELVTRRDTLRRQVDTITMSEPVRMLLGVQDSALMASRAEAQSCSVALLHCNERVRLLAIQRDSADHTIVELRMLYERESKRANPGLFRRLEIALPWMAGAFVLGVVIAK